jgi:hypothetical protein
MMEDLEAVRAVLGGDREAYAPIVRRSRRGALGAEALLLALLFRRRRRA